jgi:hypothetical protein
LFGEVFAVESFMADLPISLPLFRCVAIAVLAAGLAQAPAFAMQEPQQAGPAQAEDPHMAEEQAAQRQALGFMGYLDQGRYADSYAYTGMPIRTQLDREAFAAEIAKTRNGTGALQGRELIDSAYTTSVPGAPDGQYVVLHYHANFAIRQDVVETVTLAFAKGYWRVVGYYLK